MLNNVVLIGRATRDAELRYIPDGTPVAGFAIAVDRGFKKKDGTKDTDFFDIVIWRELAEICAKYVVKGMLVAIRGQLQSRTYEATDGNKRKVVEIVADRVEFLSKPKDTAAATFGATEVGEA